MKEKFNNLKDWDNIDTELGRFVVESILDHEQRITDTENKVDNLEVLMNSMLDFLSEIDPEKIREIITKINK